MIQFLGTDKCAICSGEILIASVDGRVTYTHNGFCYVSRNVLARECSDRQRINSVLRR